MSHTLSLRERKKAQTRAAIQQAALDLFNRQGYEETTTVQIAQAAHVSPATFFRYFKTKEDVVFFDAMDFIMHNNGAPPSNLSPVAAVRWMLEQAFSSLTRQEAKRQRQRYALICSVPELRRHMADELIKSSAQLQVFIARRAHKSVTNPEVTVTSGAVIGVILTTLLAPHTDYAPALTANLTSLEAHMKQ